MWLSVSIRWRGSGSAGWWWLRAPQFTGYSDWSSALQLAYDTGKLTYQYAGNAYLVAFGIYYDALAQVRRLTGAPVLRCRPLIIGFTLLGQQARLMIWKLTTTSTPWLSAQVRLVTGGRGHGLEIGHTFTLRCGGGFTPTVPAHTPSVQLRRSAIINSVWLSASVMTHGSGSAGAWYIRAAIAGSGTSGSQHYWVYVKESGASNLSYCSNRETVAFGFCMAKSAQVRLDTGHRSRGTWEHCIHACGEYRKMARRTSTPIVTMSSQWLSVSVADYAQVRPQSGGLRHLISATLSGTDSPRLVG